MKFFTIPHDRLREFAGEAKSRGLLYVEITLSKKEFDIIAELSLNAGRVFSREKIYENIWGFDKNGNNETVIEHIRRIRMKLSEVSDYEYIKTVWGCGYTWNL